MIITCIKILKYRTQLEDKKETFDYLCKVCKQDIDPPLEISEQFLINDNSVVLHSTLRRAKDSLMEKDSVLFIPTHELNEVIFDLEKLCTFEEWKIEKSSVVRKRFKDFFMADTLPQTRKEIFDQIRKIFEIIKEYKNREVILVSHSFRLKLLEAYVKTEGRIENSPELIHQFIFNDKKTFDFGERFDLEIIDN